MSITKTYTLKVDTDGAEKDLKGLEKSIDNVDKEVKKTSSDTSELTGQLDKLTNGAVSGFKKMTGSLKLVTTGFKGMRTAIISTGIGALIIGIVALTAAFRGSEEGQNKFNKIMGVIGALTGNLVDLLADLGEGIINAFTNPVESLKNFSKSIKEFILDRVDGVIDSMGLLGGAIKKAFSGDFKGALKDAKDGFVKLNNNINPVVMAVNAATKAVVNFTKEQIKEGKAAAQVADMRAKADKIERNLIVERSKLESEIALLRLKSREEDKFTAEERKQALLDAQVLEDSLLDKETEYLELRRDAQIQENTFSRSNKENLTKEAEAIAAVNRQVASRANTARQVQREVNTISKQIQADNKADAAAEKAKNDQKIADEKTRTDAIGKIQKEFVTKQQDAEAETELQKIALEQERKIAELDRLDATEAQKAEVIKFYQNQIQGVKDKNADDDLKKEKILQNQKIAIVGQTFGTMAKILGENSKAGKAFAIAQALTNTYLGVTEVLDNETTLPEPFGTIQKVSSIAGVLATGFAAVKSIKSVRPGGGGGGTPSLPSGGGSSPTPPAFNVVGSSGESQLADAIGGQTQRPARAYVVSNDVTTAQELDRNIIEGASI
tara:strand:+ start:550 stop:2379 length:1830 start_codon:yes stop_codon:yes gene_type:complete